MDEFKAALKKLVIFHNELEAEKNPLAENTKDLVKSFKEAFAKLQEDKPNEIDIIS